MRLTCPSLTDQNLLSAPTSAHEQASMIGACVASRPRIENETLITASRWPLASQQNHAQPPSSACDARDNRDNWAHHCMRTTEMQIGATSTGVKPLARHAKCRVVEVQGCICFALRYVHWVPDSCLQGSGAYFSKRDQSPRRWVWRLDCNATWTRIQLFTACWCWFW